jgi:hypothetical protein
MPVPDSARLFVCTRCRAQVIVCRRCDRGQSIATVTARCSPIKPACEWQVFATSAPAAAVKPNVWDICRKIAN